MSKTVIAALTLTSALELGLKNSPEVESANSQIRQSTFVTRQSVGEIFPKIAAKGSATASQNPVVLRSGTGGTTTSYDESYSAYLELTQPLYAGGAVTSGLALAKLKESFAEQNELDARQTQARDILKSFFETVSLQGQMQAAHDNLTVLENYLQVVQRYTNIGRARAIDKMQSEVNYALAESEKHVLETQLKNQLQELSALLGSTVTAVSPSKELTLINPISTEKALDEAQKSNPKILKIDIQKRMTELENDLDLVTDRPSLNLVGQLGYKSPDRNSWFKDEAHFYSVGLNLTVPLFSGFTSLAKKSVHAEKIQQQEKQKAIALRELDVRVRDLLQTLSSLEKQLKLTQKAAIQARRALELANNDYRQNLVSSQDIVQFQRSRFETEKQFVRLEAEYQLALLNLRYELGVNLERSYGAKQ